VFRAVFSSLAVAVVLGGLFLAYDLALGNGARLPGGDLRTLAGVAFVVAVTGLGGVDHVSRRAAAGPIAYLALVVLFQVLKPLLAR
jgi:hypothetical protein